MARVSRYLVFALLAGVLIWAFPGFAQRVAQNAEWRSYGSEGGSTRYSSLDQINRDNVKDLQVAWTWKFDNFGGGNSETTPIFVDGVLYFTVGPRRNVVAVNAGTGETLWTWRPDEGARFDQAPRKVARGVAYWTDGADARIVTVTPGFQLVALNAKTGIPIPGFGKDGSVDLFTQLDLTIAERSDRKDRQQFASCHFQRRDRHRPGADSGRHEPEQRKRQGRRPGVRRPHRKEALDLPHHPAKRRTRIRNMVERIGGLHRQRRSVGTDSRPMTNWDTSISPPNRRPTTATAAIVPAPIFIPTRSFVSISRPAR